MLNNRLIQSVQIDWDRLPETLGEKMEKKKPRKKRGYSCIESGYLRESIWEKIRRNVRNIRCAYQRVHYGYCDRDVWSIDFWFLNIVPDMIRELRKTMNGYPQELEKKFLSESNNESKLSQSDVSKQASAEWKRILARMEFLLREANEETCRRKNRYTAEYNRCQNEFSRKYGPWGEKLKTPEEKEREKRTGGRRIRSMCELPEYKDIWDKYMAEEKRLWKYRDRCKNKGIEMFNKWFRNLWD